MAAVFTSDTHFEHAGARSLYRRPFRSVAAMDAAMIERWNEVVGAEDEVWHLGDFAIMQATARVADLLARLNRCRHLVTGNNDSSETRALPGWTSVRAYGEPVLNGIRLVLCTWHDIGKGSINLHGHCHGRLKRQPRQLDAGVDVWDFRPMTPGDILAASGQETAGSAGGG